MKCVLKRKLVLSILVIIASNFFSNVLAQVCPSQCPLNIVLLGNAAGTLNTGDKCTIVGALSGFNNKQDHCSFFGYRAGSINNGQGNSFFGSDAGQVNTSGSFNAFFGADAGLVNSLGESNCFFGQSAGRKNLSGSINCFVGSGAGRSNETGSSNSFFGAGAGQNITADRCVAIGSFAGPGVSNGSVSDRLYIDVKESNDPLIYGEFDNDLVRVNGSFEAMGIGNNSDRHLKENIKVIDSDEILKKVAKLKITKWSYIEDSLRHIGPMAQDFFAAFGLGKNETTITTIDADGVALAAVQALKRQNDQIRMQNIYLQKELGELINRMDKLESKHGLRQ